MTTEEIAAVESAINYAIWQLKNGKNVPRDERMALIKMISNCAKTETATMNALGTLAKTSVGGHEIPYLPHFPCYVVNGLLRTYFGRHAGCDGCSKEE